jgi:hypothetical protein
LVSTGFFSSTFFSVYAFLAAAYFFLWSANNFP